MIRSLIVVPLDPCALKIGGIASFVEGFVSRAPADFSLELVGVTADPRERPVGRWQTSSLAGREVRCLPVALMSAPGSRARVPLLSRFVLGLLARRRLISVPGRILQFHRPATSIPLESAPGAARLRVVHLTTGQLTSPESESRFRGAAWLLDRLERRSLSRMDRIFVVNRDATEAYRARFPELAARTTFLPNWVDDRIFRPCTEVEARSLRAELRARINAEPEAPVVLFGGRLERQKDPMLLLDAMSVLLRDLPHARLVIAGEGSLRAAIRRRAEELQLTSSIHLVGRVGRDELAKLMCAADVMAISSAFETGPTVGLEALATGLPVVTTRVGEVARIVAEGGAGGVVEGREPAELAHVLAAALRIPREELARAAIRAAEPFRAEAVLAPFYAAHRALAATLAGAMPQ